MTSQSTWSPPRGFLIWLIICLSDVVSNLYFSFCLMIFLWSASIKMLLLSWNVKFRLTHLFSGHGCSYLKFLSSLRWELCVLFCCLWVQGDMESLGAGLVQEWGWSMFKHQKSPETDRSRITLSLPQSCMPCAPPLPHQRRSWSQVPRVNFLSLY